MSADANDVHVGAVRAESVGVDGASALMIPVDDDTVVEVDDACLVGMVSRHP